MKVFRSLFGIQWLCFASLGGLPVVLAADPVLPQSTVDASENSRPFGIIDGVSIDAEQFLHSYRTGIREAFYHGKVAQSELDTFRARKVNELVTAVLLAEEAKRRGLQVTKDTIEGKLKVYREKNQKVENWDQVKDRVVPAMRKIIEREELTALLRADVEGTAYPTSSLVLEYYDKNKEQFTAPERWHLGVIMLSVDPSSPGSVWDESLQVASELVDRIRGGESFAELAKIHSSDPSAPMGGDMGYVHIGMLSKPAQQVIKIMAVGDISEPVMLLQGVSIFRLDGIEAPRLNEFRKVEQRAVDLLLRKQKQQSWNELRVAIWKGKAVKLDAEFAGYLKPPTLADFAAK